MSNRIKYISSVIAVLSITSAIFLSIKNAHADTYGGTDAHYSSSYGCINICGYSDTSAQGNNIHWKEATASEVQAAMDKAYQGQVSDSAKEAYKTCIGAGAGDSEASPIYVAGFNQYATTGEYSAGEFRYGNLQDSYAQYGLNGKTTGAHDEGFSRSDLVPGAYNSDGSQMTVQQLFDAVAEKLGVSEADLSIVCAAMLNDKPKNPNNNNNSGRCPDTIDTAQASNSATGNTFPLPPCSSGVCETPDDTTAMFLHQFSFIPGCHGGACSGGSVTPPAVINGCFAPLGGGCSASASATYPSTAHFQQIVHYRELWHTEHYSCHCSTDSEGHRSCSTCSRRVFDGCEESGRSPWQWTGDSGTSSVSTSGSVINPYKYRLEPKSDDPESDHVYTGEKTTIGGEVTNYPGPNQNKNTHTYSYRKTLVRLVEFTVAPDKSSDGVPGGTGADPCNFFKNRYYDGQVWECNTVWEQTRKIAPNETVKHSEVRNIPDTKPLGTKYCYAIGAYTIDSGNNGMGNPPSDSWVVSGASCTTISKKPNFQIWNSGVYTNGSIVTSLSPKTIGGGFAPNDDSTKTIFGSWEEQIAIVGGTAAGFASGNTLGYSNYTFALPGGIGYNSQLTVNRKYQPISPLTISNTGNEIGNSKITALPTALLSRLNARYRPENEEVKGDFTYHGDNLYNGTKVIYSTGTVTIDKDICYGSCDSNHNINTNQVIALNQQSLSSSAISDFPQILIFAKNINITGNVERLDAWLIAEDTINTCSGFKSNDTEAGFNNGVSAGFNTASCNRQLITNGPIFAKHLALNRTAGAYNGGGTSEPDDVRGQNLSNDGSITPAEIFNLRPDTYLWAYSQAQDFTEAVVTYSRELAPRL